MVGCFFCCACGPPERLAAVNSCALMCTTVGNTYLLSRVKHCVAGITIIVAHRFYVCVCVCVHVRVYARTHKCTCLHAYIAILNPTLYLVVPSRFGNSMIVTTLTPLHPHSVQSTLLFLIYLFLSLIFSLPTHHALVELASFCSKCLVPWNFIRSIKDVFLAPLIPLWCDI
jgi:hypothetical protein